MLVLKEFFYYFFVEFFFCSKLHPIQNQMTMRRVFITSFLFASMGIMAQTEGVSINNTGASPNTNSILDVQSDTKGVLLPRLTTNARSALGALLAMVDNGMMVYDKDMNLFFYWDGTQWVQVGSGSGDNWGTQVVQTTGTNITGDGTPANPLAVTDGDSDPTNEIELPGTAIVNQVLTWDGSNWVAQNSSSGADNWGTQVVQVSGANISGDGTSANPLVVTDGDTDPTNEIELPSGGTSGQLLSTDGTGNYTWVNDNMGTDNQNIQNLAFDVNTNVLTVGIENGSSQTVDLTALLNDADNDPNNEIQDLSLNASTNILTITNNGSATSIDLSSYLDNTDNQDLSLSGNTLSLTNDGTPVDLSGYINTDSQNLSNTTSGSNVTVNISGGSGTTFSINDADSDPTNEIELPASAVNGQVLTWNGSSWIAQNAASGADNWGTQVVQTSGANISGDGTSGNPLIVTDGDSDPTNEIQNLSLSGNTLSISGGNSVTLTDTDPTNEIQNLSLTGNTLSISGANSVTLTDTDPTNEIQDISLNGTNLSITNGSTVDLSSIGGGNNSNTANSTPTVGASGVKMLKLVESQCQQDILGTAYIGADDNIWAHGYGAQYQYGVPGTTNNSFKPHIEPVDPVNGGRRGKWKYVFVDRNTLWALTDSGEVYRRGVDYNGQLGNGTGVGDLKYLTKMAYFENNNIKIKYLYISPTTPQTNEGKAVFALADNGDVYAWGRNAVGQLGIGNTADQQSPLIVTTLQGRNIVKMTQSGGGGGGVSVAAISATGQLYTWGYNGYGQLGTGSTSNFNSPQFISGINAQNVVMRRWSYGTTLLINSSGNVLGAGWNGYGIIGDGTTTNRNVFTPTSNVFTNAKEIVMDVDNNAAAVVTNNGNLYVAGYNGNYGLGLGINGSTVTNYVMPSAPFQGKVKKVVIQGWGSYKSIHVLDTLGRIWACGENRGGQLGTGGTHDADPNGLFTRAMDELNGAVKFVDIQPIGHYRYDYFSMVALTEDGRVMTTGAPHYGQSGDGTTTAQGPWRYYYQLINFQ